MIRKGDHGIFPEHSLDNVLARPARLFVNDPKNVLSPPAESILFRKACQSAGHGVEKSDIPRGIRSEDGVPDAVQHDPQPFALRPQGFLGPLPLRDVADDGDGSNDVAGSVFRRRGTDQAVAQLSDAGVRTISSSLLIVSPFRARNAGESSTGRGVPSGRYTSSVANSSSTPTGSPPASLNSRSANGFTSVKRL